MSRINALVRVDRNEATYTKDIWEAYAAEHNKHVTATREDIETTGEALGFAREGRGNNAVFSLGALERIFADARELRSTALVHDLNDIPATLRRLGRVEFHLRNQLGCNECGDCDDFSCVKSEYTE
jgi:hypothetical protein